MLGQQHRGYTYQSQIPKHRALPANWRPRLGQPERATQHKCTHPNEPLAVLVAPPTHPCPPQDGVPAIAAALGVVAAGNGSDRDVGGKGLVTGGRMIGRE